MVDELRAERSTATATLAWDNPNGAGSSRVPRLLREHLRGRSLRRGGHPGVAAPAAGREVHRTSRRCRRRLGQPFGYPRVSPPTGRERHGRERRQIAGAQRGDREGWRLREGIEGGSRRCQKHGKPCRDTSQGDVPSHQSRVLEIVTQFCMCAGTCSVLRFVVN